MGMEPVVCWWVVGGVKVGSGPRSDGWVGYGGAAA